jgi:hypothetical protein
LAGASYLEYSTLFSKYSGIHVHVHLLFIGYQRELIMHDLSRSKIIQAKVHLAPSFNY